MVLPRPAEISVAALAWLVSSEGIGELHVLLAPANRWFAPGEDDRDEWARAEIGRLGWFDGQGHLEVEVAAALAVLCRAEVEVFGWITDRDRTTRVLAAAIGRQALLAVRTGESVWLSHVAVGRLVDVVVAQVPQRPAARGRTVVVARSELLATKEGRRLSPAGVHLRAASRDVRLAQQIAALPTTGGGELYVAVRDTVGRRREVEHPVRWADTSAGRWVNHVDGGGRVRVAPGTPEELVACLTTMRRRMAR